MKKSKIEKSIKNALENLKEKGVIASYSNLKVEVPTKKGKNCKMLQKTMKIPKWTALYLPSGHKHYTHSFPTKKEAIDYVEKFVCKDCKTMFSDDILGSPCGCEWLFVPTEKLGKCKKLDDVFIAAGWKKIKSLKELFK